MKRSTIRTAAPTAAGVPAAPARQGVRAQRADRGTVAGVALVAGAVLLGARAVGAADHREAVWALRAPMAAGALVTEADLVPAMAAVEPGLSAYVGAGRAPAPGTRLRHDLGAGELLPVAALAPAAGGDDRRLVTVPVEPLHAPPGLARGERVDVYLTPRDTGAGVAAVSSDLVLRGVLVADVPAASDSATDSLAVVLDLPATAASRAVAAVRSGAVDLVRVPAAAPTAPTP